MDSGNREGSRLRNRGAKSRAFRNPELAPSFILYCLRSSPCQEGKGEEVYFIHQKEVRGTLTSQDLRSASKNQQCVGESMDWFILTCYMHFFLHYANFYDWTLHSCLYVCIWTVAIFHFLFFFHIFPKKIPDKSTGMLFSHSTKDFFFPHYLIFFWACFLNIIY